MKKIRKWLYSGIALLGIGALSTYAWFAQKGPHVSQAAQTSRIQSDQAERRPAGDQAGGARAGGGRNTGPVTVEVARVASATLRDDIQAAGTLQSNESVMLRPEVAGRIARINFSDGQAVSKGQILVELDSSLVRAELQQAQAELSIAQANFRRTAELAQQKFIAERAKDEAAANVQVLEAKLALARARLDRLTIRAPFAGIVGIRNVSVGDYVRDGADLVNLEDISSVKVDFRLPEKFVGQLRKGQAVLVAVDAFPGQEFEAKVDAINPQIDSAGRSVLLRGRIPNSHRKLKPGMFARVKVILAERSNALLIPEEAVVPQGDQMMVWKVVDGQALRAPVKTGLRRDAKVEILDGLRAGDIVITAGQVRLHRDGTAVKVAQQGQVGNAADKRGPI